MDDELLDFYAEPVQKKYKGKTMETDKIEEKVDKPNRKKEMMAIILIISLILLCLYIYKIEIPTRTCQKICENKNLTYKSISKNQTCICQTIKKYGIETNISNEERIK